MNTGAKKKDRGGQQPGRRVRKRASEPLEAERGTSWDGRSRLLIGLFMLLNLVFCLLLFDPKLHTGGDSSEYVSLAESVLRSGDGYSDSMAPGAPVPHTKYPPGYPVLMAPLLAIFGRNFVVLKLLSVAFTVSSVLVFCVLSKERAGPPLWLAMSLAFAASPVVVDYSHWLLSEAPFLFFTLLALLFLQRDTAEEDIGKYFWLSIFAIVATFYIRSVGIVFIGAGSLFYLIKRRWRKCLYYNVVGAALSLPWLIRNQLLQGSATPYIEEFLLRSIYEPEAGYHGLWGMIGRLFTNLSIYSAREMPRVLAGSNSLWSTTVPMKGLSLVLCGFMVTGFLYVARKRLGVAEIYFALSCLAILLFEEVVSDVRYLMPLVPLMLFYISDGLTLAAEKFTSLRNHAAPAVAMMALIATIGISSQLARAPQNMEMIGRYRAGDRFAGYAPNWRSFFEASDWVSANTPEDAVVTVRKPRLFHLWTGRKITEYPFSTDPDSVLDVILRTDFVVVDQISGTTGRYLIPAIENAPERFRAVFQSDRPPTWILQVRGPPAGGQ